MTDTNSAHDALEEALKETFPASDPISVQQPVVAGGYCTCSDRVDASRATRKARRKPASAIRGKATADIGYE
jgi:hypothetical protein